MQRNEKNLGNLGVISGKLGRNLGKFRGTLREFCWSPKGPKPGKFFRVGVFVKEWVLLKLNFPKVLESYILVFPF